jgi:hypothetical protein
MAGTIIMGFKEIVVTLDGSAKRYHLCEVLRANEGPRAGERMGWAVFDTVEKATDGGMGFEILATVQEAVDELDAKRTQ